MLTRATPKGDVSAFNPANILVKAFNFPPVGEEDCPGTVAVVSDGERQAGIRNRTVS